MIVALRGDALLLATGHLAGILLERFRDIERARYILDAGGDARGTRALDGKGKRDVLHAGQGVKQVGVLEDETELVTAKGAELVL